MTTQTNDLGVAVIGMAGRFPKADTTAQLWENIRSGRECISEFTEEEVIASGVSPEIVRRPDYLRRKGAVSDIDRFDAPFFSISPREAELTDPQHRLMLQCAWNAMEDAGYDPTSYQGDIGVFAGKSLDSYLMLNVLPTFKKVFSSGSLQAAIGNDKDSMTTQIAYHLNLTGPAITIQTSSSTSLVAVCSAAQSLLTWQCDLALAGGVTLGPPIHSGYLAQEGGITSHDGHCRAFDAASSGFVPGTGLGLVVLKRLDDAIRDNDSIISVIRGFAVNNDGSQKVSYTAPSVDAQARVIARAHAMAGWTADELSYVEAHGTGTRMGDPIEVSALTNAFRKTTDKTSFCWLGSVKSNIGHLDTAAGVTGLIKASLSIKHGEIPASVNYATPNPACNFESSPFKVVQELTPWVPDSGVRRAGVTSLGMGGTNAHVVLEQAPERSKCEARQLALPYILSARSETALARQIDLQGKALSRRDSAQLLPQDAAFTLAVGRKAMPWRAAVVARSIQEAGNKFLTGDRNEIYLGQPGLVSPLAFLFTGQGSQYPAMGADLYKHDADYRDAFNSAAEAIAAAEGPDLRNGLYGDEDVRFSGDQLAQTHLTQPALFAVEYALAMAWLARGITPGALIGHSLGEWVAAVVANVMSLETAARLVIVRANAMATAPSGAMLSIRADASQIQDKLIENVELAAENAPGLCVVAGPSEVITDFEQKLDQLGIRHSRLKTSHAFHSASMIGAATQLRDAMEGQTLHPPVYPIYSTALGRLARSEELTDSTYWSAQVLKPVLFQKALMAALEDLNCNMLEVGPGNALSSMGVLCAGTTIAPITSLPQITELQSALDHNMTAMIQLWTMGYDLSWEVVFKNQKCGRVSLPGYNFDKHRYWIASEEEQCGHDGESTDWDTDQAAASTTLSMSAAKSPRPKSLSTTFEPVASELEAKISEIFEDLLGISGIGRTDDFFELGGHSLMASMMIARLAELHGISLDTQTFFTAPNIADLTAELEKRGKAGSTSLVESLLTDFEVSSELLEHAQQPEEVAK
ncbi:type I polyketide synthase [Pseudovibrio sp. FO-BEG1]|uniref:type I polyketide synthase n=1 Tax=Pseudovibrio sp. (strain FO-BEG1) TaxID=911045 RepID=UPI0002DA3924|nr:type I polyketide synthase [Pseudovibrio sp. FO-BEG1]